MKAGGRKISGCGQEVSKRLPSAVVHKVAQKLNRGLLGGGEGRGMRVNKRVAESAQDVGRR
eukprot:277740-Chlamydomonas_euryale.AAC.1